MIYSRFRRGIIIRVISLSLCLLLLAWLIFNTTFYVSTAFVLICCILQVILLIRFSDRTNDRLAKFFSAIRYDDFTQMFAKGGSDKSLTALNRELNDVMASFRNVRQEGESQRLFLQNIFQHIGNGLIVFDSAGKVIQVNTAFKRMVQSGALNNLREIPEKFRDMREKLPKLNNGDSILVKIPNQGELLQLSITVSEFIILDQRMKLASIQNIGPELNEKELEAWHNLTRVLAHEIMNSMTPIISLAGSVTSSLKNNAAEVNQEEIIKAVETIERRSEGLLKFVETYRSISRIPRPEYKLVTVRQLFDNVLRLLKDRLQNAGIKIDISPELPDIAITADPALIEQVLINLIINAIEALEGVANAVIKLSAGYDVKSRVEISVEDNGKGILEEVQEKIFIPFFTTKRKGSGIGLSLSRQIMRLHSGNIFVYSEPGTRTIFTLRF